jgi:DNA processing protein
LKYSTKHHQIALTLLSGIGSKRARIVLSHFADLEEFFTEKKLDILQIPGLSSNAISFQHRQQALDAAGEILLDLEKCEGDLIFFNDKNFPRRLKQCEDAPLLLYTKGNFNWNSQRIISIVGTRNMTSYGQRILEEFMEAAAPHQPTIVSGLAYGVDITAHQLAMKHGLPTWCVMGNGLNKIYPAIHKKIAFASTLNGGLLSEFVPNQKAEAAHFPMRNRIVAGISDATIVIESGNKGGSLITANMARDYQREVAAFPGDVNKPFSKGCNTLIRTNIASLNGLEITRRFTTSSNEFI